MKGLKDLLIPSITFRPFAQHWAHEAFLTQNSMHWMSTEIDFSKDKMDYEKFLKKSTYKNLGAVIYIPHNPIDILAIYTQS